MLEFLEITFVERELQTQNKTRASEIKEAHLKLGFIFSSSTNNPIRANGKDKANKYSFIKLIPEIVIITLAIFMPKYLIL